MNHAVVIKPKSISQKLFTLSHTSPSFEFKVKYVPALLRSYERGGFDWINSEVSQVENVKGPLGTLRPSQVMLTKKLHGYGSYDHNYELIIKHNLSQSGVGQNDVFFVFFLQGVQNGPENPLDSFLEKKTETLDVETFIKPSLNSRSGNVYYRTDKMKHHVFVFPTVLSVKNESLHKITGTPKPSSQVYREVILRDFVFESNNIHLEYGKEKLIEPVSQDVVMQQMKTAEEGFQNMTCYPVDEDGETSYAQVVIGSGKDTQALEDTSMMFGYGVLFFILFIFGGLIGYLGAYSYGGTNDVGFYCFCILYLAFLFLGIFFPAAATDDKLLKDVSKPTANVIGYTFLVLYATGWVTVIFLQNATNLLTEKTQFTGNMGWLFLSIIFGPIMALETKTLTTGS